MLSINKTVWFRPNSEIINTKSKIKKMGENKIIVKGLNKKRGYFVILLFKGRIVF